MEILRFAAENILRLVDVLILKIRGRPEEEIAAADAARKEFFNRREMRFQPYADGFYVNLITDGIVACESGRFSIADGGHRGADEV